MVFRIVNILEACDRMEEAGLDELLSSFACPNNKRIEHFLQANAISCARQRFAITYLVMNDDSELAGFFTLTHKPVLFDREHLDGKRRRQVKQFCVRSVEEGEESEQLLASAFLIAQLAKNAAPLAGRTVTGGELVDFAMRTLMRIQWSIGGGLVFLECEDVQKLLDFYEKHGFCKFGERVAQIEGEVYHQLLRTF